MENENKNNNKPRRPKPYFIAPNDAQAQPKKAEGSAPSDVSEKDNAKKAENRHHNRNRNRNKNKVAKPEGSPSSEKPTNQEKSQSANIPQGNPAESAQRNTPQPQGNAQKNKNRRNRHKHKKPSEVTPELEATVTAQQKAEPSQAVESNDTLAFPSNDRLEKPQPKKLESFSASPEFQKYQDYEEFTYEELYGSKDNDLPQVSPEPSKKEEDHASEANVEVVGIRFKASGKTYYFAPNGITLRIGMHAIVDTSRGLEYGEVVMGNSFIAESEIVPPLRSIIRAATQDDARKNEEIKKNEEAAFRICNEKIIAHGLDMKLIDAQYTFDSSKLLFYFTSSGRVDFRDLVKDLASIFRTRIELRQIGIRDEAKMVGGLGICGRPLCCAKFLTDFGQVSIKMAKEQNLSLNSAKISGICGRLMCCLRYEHDTYEYEIKRTPPVDTLVRTVDGVGTVTEISPLQGTIKVRLAATPEVMPKTYNREDVTILKKKN